MTMAFILAAIAAFKLLRNRYSEDRQYHKKALKMTMIVGFLSTILSMVAGTFQRSSYTKFNLKN